METILAAFERKADGSWTCIQACTLEGPGGRIQVAEGTVFRRGGLFMGIDVARLLEAHRRGGSPPRD